MSRWKLHAGRFVVKQAWRANALSHIYENGEAQDGRAGLVGSQAASAMSFCCKRRR